MNTDIRFSLDFFQNRKTKKLKKRIGSEGVLALIRLWVRVAKNKPKGVLVGWDSEDIAIEADYSGDSLDFVNSLVDIGFIDETESGYALHNWETRQPWAFSVNDRGDKARMSMLARINKKAHDKLKSTGVNAISREEYNNIVKPTRIDSETLSSGYLSDSETIAGGCVDDIVSPAPAPSPSPSPTPDPSPTPNPSPSPTPNPSPYEEDNKCEVKKDKCVEKIDTALIIFQHWQKVHDHSRAQFDKKRRKVISLILKTGYSFQDCIDAINGCKKSPYHQGENDNNRIYDAFDLIFRNAEKIDYFIAQNKLPDMTGCSPAGRATLMAGASLKKKLEKEELENESQ